MAKSERWFNPFWFPSETKIRFGLVLLVAGCLSLFAARRVLEALDYRPLAWVWLALVLVLPTIWRLADQSILVLRRRLTLTPVETHSPTLDGAVARLTHDPWLDLPSTPQTWVTYEHITPTSFGIGHRKHIILPHYLLVYYRPDVLGMSAELEAVLRHELAHVRNGDLRLKGLAHIAFIAALCGLLGLLPWVVWSALLRTTEPVVSVWEAFYLALALLGNFYLYHSALRQRELYADARVTLGMGSGKPLKQGLATVDREMVSARNIETAIAHLGMGLTAPEVWWQFPGGHWLGRLLALYGAYPNRAQREDALFNPNRLFRGADRGLVFLSGFLPVLAVGLLFSLLPRETVDAALFTGLSQLWPRLAELVAEGREGLRATVISVSPVLGAAISQTTLVDSLQAAIRVPLALWVLTRVLVGPVTQGKRFSALEVSALFVVGVLAAQTSSLEVLGLLLLPQAGGSNWAILLGYLQALISALALAVMVFFYVFALRGLLRRYPSPPQFLRWLRWSSILFIGVVAWETLGAVPLGSTVDMLPYLATPKLVKWLLILMAVAWLGLTTRRRCPACNVVLTMKGDEDISSPHRCRRCEYPLYQGWTEARIGEVAGQQVVYWLKTASGEMADEVMSGLRRIARQTGLNFKALQKAITQIAPAGAERLEAYRPPKDGPVVRKRFLAKARGIWSGLFTHQKITRSDRPHPLVVVTVVQGIMSAGVLIGLAIIFWLGGTIAFNAPEKLYSYYLFKPEPTADRLIGDSVLAYGFFVIAVLGFLTYVLLRGTWEGRPWAYALNLILAGLLCATIILSVIGVPLLWYLLRPETRHHFGFKHNSTVPLASHLLTALCTVAGIALILFMAWFLTQLLVLLDPATYDKWRSWTFWSETFSLTTLPVELPVEPWIQIPTMTIPTFVQYILLAFLLAYGAQRGWSWAYLIGVGCVVIIALIPLFSPLAILLLFTLLKPEVRQFYGIARRRPLVVDLVASYFILMGFESIGTFLLALMTSIGQMLSFSAAGVTFDPVGGFAFFLVLNVWPAFALLSLSSFFLAWGGLKGKRWAYVLTIGGLLVHLAIGLGYIFILLRNPERWITGSGAWIVIFSILVPIPAVIALLRPQARRYFGITPERPLIIDLTLALHLVLGLVALILVCWAAVSASTLLAITNWQGKEALPIVGVQVDRSSAAGAMLSLLNLGDFLVIPSFILAAAIWQGRAWAYRVSLLVITLLAASFILTPIALPMLIAVARPAVRRLYTMEDETAPHPLVSVVVAVHYLNLILWSILLLFCLYFGITGVSSPTRVQSLGILPSEFTTQDTFWLGVLLLWNSTLLIIGIALTILTIYGVKKRRSWAYLTSLGLAAYGLTGIQMIFGVQFLFINLIPLATGLALLIILVLRPTRQHFFGDAAWVPSAAVSLAALLWFLFIQVALVSSYELLGIIIAQSTHLINGAAPSGVLLSSSYIFYAASAALLVFVGAFGVGMARGLCFGQRWAYLFTLATLVLACLAIVPAIIALPLLIALRKPDTKTYFADHRLRPLVVELLSLAYVGLVWLCLWLALVSVPVTESRNVTILTDIEVSLYIPEAWQTTDVVIGIVALAGVLGFALLAVAIWRGRPWAHRVSVGLGMLGSLTVIGAIVAIPATIALLRPKARRFFEPDQRPHRLLCPACGTSTLVGAWFCVHCGTRLGTSCPLCDSSMPNGAAFCPGCGMRLETAMESHQEIGYDLSKV